MEKTDTITSKKVYQKKAKAISISEPVVGKKMKTKEHLKREREKQR